MNGPSITRPNTGGPAPDTALATPAPREAGAAAPAGEAVDAMEDASVIVAAAFGIDEPTPSLRVVAGNAPASTPLPAMCGVCDGPGAEWRPQVHDELCLACALEVSALATHRPRALSRALDLAQGVKS